MFWTRRSVWQRVGLPALGCSLHLVRLASVPWLCKYTQCIRVTYWDALRYLIGLFSHAASNPNAFGAHAQFLAFDWPGVTFLEDRLFKTRQNPRPAANLPLHYTDLFFLQTPREKMGEAPMPHGAHLLIELAFGQPIPHLRGFAAPEADWI